MNKKPDPFKKGKQVLGPRGRVTKYTEEIAREICLRLSEGESLTAICNSPGFPPRSTVAGWVYDDYDGFAARYAQAREIGFDAIGEEIVTISNTPVMGEKTISKPGGLEVITADMIEHRRLQVDARKWFLAKMAPKKYGDRSKSDDSDDGNVNILGGSPAIPKAPK